MKPIHFFVYGTLRRGQSNYQRLLDGKNGFKFIGYATTENKYTMLSSGIPFVHKQPETSLIRGEVIMVWEKYIVKDLDALEASTLARIDPPLLTKIDPPGTCSRN